MSFSSDALLHQITSFNPQPQIELVPDNADRWILASNLQKAIRRGLAHTAVATAYRLLQIDARYFWRRLLVVAYEDIGYGDISLCHDLLKTFRREALHRDLGVKRVAGYFVTQLAQALKSRSLCDGIAMLEFNVRRAEYEAACFDMADDELVAVACDVQAASMDRLAALRHLCGYHEFKNGQHRTLAKPRPELMRAVCQVTGMTEVETTLFLSGQNVAESLNIPIPLVAQMNRVGQRTLHSTEYEFEGVSGILFCAIDRHTRMGKQCYARLVQQSKPLQRFFSSHPTRDPVAALGAAVFIVESASLNRWILFDGADSLRHAFEQIFLEYHGINRADEFLSSVRNSLGTLNKIRARLI